MKITSKGQVTIPADIREKAGLLPETEVETHHLMNKDSLDMDDADRQQVLRAVKEKLGDGVPIIISHGTDTMVETGLLLKAGLTALKVPVILTGAMVPLGFENSDALQNLTESLMAASLLSPGVYIVMHNQAFPVDRVRKDRDLGRFVWKTEADS